MDDERQSIKVRILNHLTGEITDIEVNSADQAKNLYIELSASATAINKAKDALRNYLDEFLGQDEKYQFVDGKILRRVQRTSLSYRVETLREYLDEDQLSVILKVDTKAADMLIGEMQERGELPPGTLKKIREQADITATKPFVEVR
jgi:phage host-nuclease inhibitor protein Gam